MRCLAAVLFLCAQIALAGEPADKQWVKIAPKGMGLNDFVAQEEGFFTDEGLEVEFDSKTFRLCFCSSLSAAIDAANFSFGFLPLGMSPRLPGMYNLFLL